MSYDPRCLALARLFLEDVGVKGREDVEKELADAIQCAIEDFISEKGLS